jgi:hypothetical protein
MPPAALVLNCRAEVLTLQHRYALCTTRRFNIEQLLRCMEHPMTTPTA